MNQLSRSIDGVRPANTEACEKCGGSDFIDGHIIESHGNVKFRYEGMRWFKWGLKMHAHACRACGSVSLFVDPAELPDA